MALLTRGIEAAQQAVEKAKATVTEWEDKASAARSEASELDANAGALILADDTQAEKISIQIQSLERRARAYDGAAIEARQRLLVKQRRVLEVEAEGEEKAAQDAEKRLRTHTGKVRALQDQLKELDGAEYIPDPRDHLDEKGNSWTWHSSAVTLEGDVRRHKIRGAAIRHFIATGEVAQDGKRFDTGITWGPNELAPGFIGSDYIPESLYTARDAGLNFSRMGA